MATTTNYAWETPDDTDLVKDGAAAIRTLGSSIDTTTKALNPSTTLGDIEYRSSTANTNTRLGIGSTGQVLTVAGGVPSWSTLPASGSLIKLASNTFSAVSSVSLPNSTFTSTYRNYKLIFNIDTMASSPSGVFMRLRASGTDNTNASWYGQMMKVPYTGATSVAYSTTAGTSIQVSDDRDKSMTIFEISNPNTAQRTGITYQQAQAELASSNFGGAAWIDNQQFDALTLLMTSGTMTGRYTVYGYAQ